MAPSRRTTGLAKLSRPRLYEAVPRERLFRLLDEQRQHRVMLVAAPPGAGKTTLVASYLESRKLPGIWYQVDPGDGDPSTFFYFLGCAERALSTRARGTRPLPLLTPEHLPDLAGFARRFFRDLFSRLDEPSTLVFDNFQEAADDSPLHAALIAGLEEVPDGIRVFLISRHPPPDRYVRLAANRAMGLVDWEQIKLTADEAMEVLGSARVALDERTAEALHARSGGWAAGLILLAEHLRRGGAVTGHNDPDSLTQVFAYFAGQLFDRAPQDDRLALLRLSYLPSVRESHASALTGRDDAGTLLESLFRRHLFTDRRRADETIYTFHALFRAFLQHRAQTDLTPAQRQDAARRAAQLLEAAGQPEAAMALYTLANDLESAEALVFGQAAALIGQGRWKVVVGWIESLPQDRVAANAWLLHWLGTAQIGVDPPGARSILERAYVQAAQRGDAPCQVQVAAGMVEAHFLEYSVFTPLDRWIPVLEHMFEHGFAFPTLDAELRAQSALLVSATYRQPDHVHIERCATRVQELLHTGLDINLRVSAGTHLCLYGSFTGHLAESQRAAHLVAPLLGDPAVTGFRRIFAWAVISWYACNTSDFELGPRALATNEAITRDEGIHIAERFACILGYFLDVDRRDTASARRRLDRFEQIMTRAQPYEAASLVNMQSWWGVYTDDVAYTLRYGPQAVRLYQEAGSIPHIMVGLNALVWGYVEAGDVEAARAAIAEHRSWSDRHNLEWARWSPDAAEAMLALRGGDEGTLRERLRRVFAQERGTLDEYGHQLAWCRGWAATLAAEALRREIEPARVRRFIRQFELRAPSPDLEAWPWPVRVHALGRFELRVDDRLVAFSGKAPKKPLALLKAIVCFGGQDVKDYQLVDALWPDDEGDSARDTFRVAMHRLRKILAHPDAVLVEEGRVSLNRDLCWVDALAFDELLQAGREPTREPDAAHERALALYRGALLPSDREEPWTMPMRERLRSKFMHHFARLGSLLEARQAWDQALDLYLRGLDADNLTESFYQGLMRCHAALGRHTDALGAYRQLRETLAATLGIGPSPATEALYQTLQRTSAQALPARGDP
jgi:DNA-binding SARP family transcriptional activator